MEELLSQHRKEIKALDGEKRAAIKKAKATKGKKSKDDIARYVYEGMLPVLLSYHNIVDSFIEFSVISKSMI